MKSSYLEPDKLITITSVEEPKIYIREQFGFYQKVRRGLGWFLMVLFIAIPFFRFNQQQAVLFDVEQQTLQFFSFTLFPQDLFIFSLVFAVAAFGLFYVTRIYGRVWCGFMCPQTIWMLMFNWIERRVEGTANQSKQLDKSEMTASKLVKKVMKHTFWLLVSLLTALVFMSYFVPVDLLYGNFFTLNSSSLVVGWVLFFAMCTYINAGWIREKMCQHMCPYSRFQSAMFISETKLVTYDHSRGETRGMRKRSQTKPEGMGDCVDCNLCVEVCPVGIDIRNGLQYECINCGLCVDACNQTMDKFGYEQGLIAFEQERKNDKRWQQHISYGVVLLILVLAMGIWASLWQSLDVNIIRDRNALYRINEQGNTENTYLVKIRNKSQQSQMFTITLNDESGITIDKPYRVEVQPSELKIVPLVAINTQQTQLKTEHIRFEIAAETTTDVVDKEVTFYHGEGGW